MCSLVISVFLPFGRNTNEYVVDKICPRDVYGRLEWRAEGP